MSWSKSGSTYTPGEYDVIDRLPNGVFEVALNERGQLVLHRISDRFDFSYKVYGIDESFIQRVVRTFHHRSGNLGVLLHGVKGTGKTVAAKLIANKTGLPIILVNHAFKGLSEFISNIAEEVVLIFDEFEKEFENSSKLLPLLDGVLSMNGKKLFLFTSNRDHINYYMRERPNRIRYIKYYGEMERETIEEIMDDMLSHQEFRPALLETIKALNLVTIDILKNLIEEINIHKEPPTTFMDILNVKTKKHRYQCFTKEGKLVGNVGKISEYGLENRDYLTIEDREMWIRTKGPWEFTLRGKPEREEEVYCIRKVKYVHEAFDEEEVGAFGEELELSSPEEEEEFLEEWDEVFAQLPGQ